MRKRCLERGHKWIEFVDGYRPAVQACSRMFCTAMRPDPGLAPDLREHLQRLIDEEGRR